MNKQIQKFHDGEIKKYTFENDKWVILSTKNKFSNKYTCKIYWNFGDIKKIPQYNKKTSDPFEEIDTFYKIQKIEVLNLYKSLKKIKRKTQDIKLFISALLIINHDISEEIFIQQSLF